VSVTLYWAGVAGMFESRAKMPRNCRKTVIPAKREAIMPRNCPKTAIPAKREALMPRN
jgi:hypothetical protein